MIHTSFIEGFSLHESLFGSIQIRVAMLCAAYSYRSLHFQNWIDFSYSVFPVSSAFAFYVPHQFCGGKNRWFSLGFLCSAHTHTHLHGENIHEVISRIQFVIHTCWLVLFFLLFLLMLCYSLSLFWVSSVCVAEVFETIALRVCVFVFICNVCFERSMFTWNIRTDH